MISRVPGGYGKGLCLLIAHLWYSVPLPDTRAVAAISLVICVMICTRIGTGAICLALALPSLFAFNVQVSCDFMPVNLSMQEANQSIVKGIPVFCRRDN
ncbi:hypothetical protein [Enterobacter mori]|uniref:hypothetical protein n=1 Tax=Enterobacter mori TaxID=539813 RepID=UPI0020164F56|nr:hypothetical protein [Enterobacter mori]